MARGLMKKFLLEQSEVPDGSDYGSKFNTFYPQVQVLAQKKSKNADYCHDCHDNGQYRHQSHHFHSVSGTSLVVILMLGPIGSPLRPLLDVVRQLQLFEKA